MINATFTIKGSVNNFYSLAKLYDKLLKESQRSLTASRMSVRTDEEEIIEVTESEDTS